MCAGASRTASGQAAGTAASAEKQPVIARSPLPSASKPTPDTGGLVRLKDTELETANPVVFGADRARVRHAYFPTLDAVAEMLKARADVGRCAVQGQTDGKGPPDWNEVLSQKRAQAVVQYLTERGVDPARLVAISHSDPLPWAPDDAQTENAATGGTAKEHLTNRGVIFHIEGVQAGQVPRQNETQKQLAVKPGRAPWPRPQAQQAPAQSQQHQAQVQQQAR
jgi:outer membrane protein OmpA-like peptidoglycan-associated protein